MTESRVLAQKEVKIRLPSDFDGDSKKTKRFLQDVQLYLDVNEEIYDTNTKQIAFAISFMNGGTADTWKEIFLAKAQKGEKGKAANPYGTFATFKAEVLAAFTPANEEGMAQLKIDSLTQGSKTADEFVQEFQLLASKSGITDNVALISLFRRGLNAPLIDKIYQLDTTPTTIADWYKEASKFDNRWRFSKAVKPPMRERGLERQRKEQYSKKVRVLEVNAMTLPDKDEHMQRGLCFTCHQSGHMARACPQAPNSNKKVYKPTSGLDTYRQIRTMIDELEGEERNIAVKRLEEAGF